VDKLAQSNNLGWARALAWAVLFIPKTKQRNNKKTTKPRKAKMRSVVKSAPSVVVPLRANTLPKSFFKIGQRGKYVTLHTSDVIREVIGNPVVNTDQWAGPQLVYTYDLNPANTRIFPKTGSIAQVFDKWMLRKISIHFKTATSQVQNGMIGIGFLLDPSDDSPINMRDLVNYQYSTAGSICDNHTVSYTESRARELPIFSQQYYAATNPSAQNPFYTGAYKVVIIMKGVSPGVTAGWVSLVCDWELQGSRPTLQQSLSTRLNIYDGLPALTIGNSSYATTWPQVIGSNTGDFDDYAKNFELYNGFWVNGTAFQSPPPINRSLTARKAIWNHAVRAGITASSASEKGYFTVTDESPTTYTYYYINPEFIVPEPDEKGNPSTQKETWDRKVHSDRYFLAEPFSFAEGKRVAKSGHRGKIVDVPLVANDIVYTLYGMALDAQDIPITGPITILQVTANAAASTLFQACQRYVQNTAYRLVPSFWQANATPRTMYDNSLLMIEDNLAN
jgi:hypothetical protein